MLVEDAVALFLLSLVIPALLVQLMLITASCLWMTNHLNNFFFRKDTHRKVFCLLTWSWSHRRYGRPLSWIDLAPFFCPSLLCVGKKLHSLCYLICSLYVHVVMFCEHTECTFCLCPKCYGKDFVLLSSVDWMVMFILSVPVGVSYIDMYIHTPQQSLLSAVRLHSSCVICERTGSSVKFTSKESCDGRSWRCLRNVTFVIVITVC